MMSGVLAGSDGDQVRKCFSRSCLFCLKSYVNSINYDGCIPFHLTFYITCSLRALCKEGFLTTHFLAPSLPHIF